MIALATKDELKNLLIEAAREGARLALASKQNAMRPRWLTTSEAAEYLGVSNYTIGHYRNLQLIDSNGKRGKGVRYSARSVEDYHLKKVR